MAEVCRTPPRGVDARRAWVGAACVHLDSAVGPDEHDQHRGGGERRPQVRFAQDLALFNLDLSEEVGASKGFDGQAHKEVWQSAPEWQPTRAVVERLTAVEDWCELLFATNIVF